MTATVAAPATVRERTGGDSRALAFADFHCHTRFSPDSRLGEDRFIALAIERGLTHVAVTDHNTIDGSIAVRDRAGELGMSDRLNVVLAEEVTSADGEIVALFIESTIPRDLSAESPPTRSASRVSSRCRTRTTRSAARTSGRKRSSASRARTGST